MKRLGFMLKPTLSVLGIIGVLAWSGSAAAAVSNADYSGTPPFLTSVVTPNVLIELDNSGSMGWRAVCDNTDNATTVGYGINGITSFLDAANLNQPTARVTTSSSNRVVDGIWMTVRGVTGPTAADAALYNGDFPSNAPPLFDLAEYFFLNNANGDIIVYGTVATNVTVAGNYGAATPAMYGPGGLGAPSLGAGLSLLNGAGNPYNFQTGQNVTISGFAADTTALSNGGPNVYCFTGIPNRPGCFKSFNGTFRITVLDAYTFYYVIPFVPPSPPPPPPPCCAPPPPPPPPPVVDGGGILGIFPKAWAAYERPQENLHSVWRTALNLTNLLGVQDAAADPVDTTPNPPNSCSGGDRGPVANSCDLKPTSPMPGAIQLFPTTFTYVMTGLPAGNATGGGMAAYSVGNLTVSSLVSSGVGGIVTATTLAAHNFGVNEHIMINGVDGIVGGPQWKGELFNGTFQILTVPSSTTFTYQVLDGPSLGGATATSTLKRMVAADPFGACPTSTSLYPVGTPRGAPFREITRFSGVFDPLKCYIYDTANTRFVDGPTSKGGVLNAMCGPTEWDGNFLNWSTTRRHDVLKIALIGAQCFGTRNPDGTCPPSGAPGLITMKGEDGQFVTGASNGSSFPTMLDDGLVYTSNHDDGTPGTRCPNAPGTPGCGINTASGRVPNAVQQLAGATPVGVRKRCVIGPTCPSYSVWGVSPFAPIGAQGDQTNDPAEGGSVGGNVAPGGSRAMVTHLEGVGAAPALSSGGFCVGREDVANPSIAFKDTCGILASGSANGQFRIHLGVAVEPTGLIQDFGGQARFGLLEFRASSGANDGGRVIVPIGSFQATKYGSTVLNTFTSNKEAMIAGIEQSFPAVSTPLAETLYTGIRYIAQLSQPFGATNYLYPIAFASSGGPVWGTAQTAGGIGIDETLTPPFTAGELALSPPVTCDTAAPGAGYIQDACGRDPFFFAANQGWTQSSAQVACCRTFIMVLTDGEPTADNDIPVALQDYAHVAHGTHCTAQTAAWTPAAYTPGNPPGGTAPVGTYPLTASPTTRCYNGSKTDTQDPVALIPAGQISPAQEASILLQQHRQDYVFSTLNHTLDDVAYWAHVNDLRQTTIPDLAPGVDLLGGETGHDLAGFQNVTVYTLFAFGNISGREILMQAAKQGGFEDQDNDTLGPNGNHSPNLQAEWDQVDNFTGLQVPDGIPDTYFESQSANDIKDKLLAALTSILQKAASGTSVSVLATSSSGEGAVYQAFFFPLTPVNIGGTTNYVSWTGFTQGLFIDTFGNLREDYSAAACTGAPDGQLIHKHDCIIKIRLDSTTGTVKVDRFRDDDGNGTADVPQPAGYPLTQDLTTNGISNLQPIWEAGRQLALLDPQANCESSATWPKAGNLGESGRTCRRILTWADINNNGAKSGGSTETLEFSVANAFTLCPYLGGEAVAHCNDPNVAPITNPDIVADPGLAGCFGLTRATCAQNEAIGIINFVRGCEPAVCTEQVSLRNRIMNVLNSGGAPVQKVWKLGDIISSSPTIVAAPAERYDIIYGDATYSSFFQRYKDRRQVAYVGGNGGLLHAFNAGFFQQGNVTGSVDPVQARFTTTPKRPGLTTDCAALPCDASVATYTFRGDAPALGSELWAYAPQDLLPQLRWLTLGTYNHMYFVDLKPKVTDVRIFAADADHPGGWGTVLIGGFRLGGSCTNCSGGKGTPRTVQSDFNYDGDITDQGNGASGSDHRVFLSSYFVLDITNPEKDPTLLWTFRDSRLGLTTAYPAVLRVKGANVFGEGNAGPTGEKWYAVFGTGPTHHDAFANQNQTAQMFMVDLAAGPVYSDINRTSGTVNGQTCDTVVNVGAAQLGPCIAADTAVASGQTRAFSTTKANAHMADAITVDYQFDDRVDVVYAGSVICSSAIVPTSATGCLDTNPYWAGAMWRVSTGQSQATFGDTNPDNWGTLPGTSGGPFGVTGAGLGPNFACPAGGPNCPTPLLSNYDYTTAQATTCTGGDGVNCAVGPVTSAASVAADDSHNLWVFFGEGRYYSHQDKTNVDIMHFFGVKDDFISMGTGVQTTERNDLFNSSDVVVCSSCTSSSNVSTTGSTAVFSTAFGPGVGSLLNNVQNSDGWFTTFNDPTAPFQTPPRSAMTPGERNVTPAIILGGTIFFTTFTPTGDICVAAGTGLLYAVFYQTGGPFSGSAVGESVAGGNTLVNKTLSLGQGMPSQANIHIGKQGAGATGSINSGNGCGGSVTIYSQSSTGALTGVCGETNNPWSRMIAWRDL